MKNQKEKKPGWRYKCEKCEYNVIIERMHGEYEIKCPACRKGKMRRLETVK